MSEKPYLEFLEQFNELYSESFTITLNKYGIVKILELYTEWLNGSKSWLINGHISSTNNTRLVAYANAPAKTAYFRAGYSFSPDEVTGSTLW